MIIDVIEEFFASGGQRTTIGDSILSTSYSFKEDSTINATAVSGTLSIDKRHFFERKEDESNHTSTYTFTYNGNVEIGGTKYVLSDVVYSYTNEKNNPITGTITKDGKFIDTSTINKTYKPILFKLITDYYGIMKNENTAIVNAQTESPGFYYNVNAEEFNGEFSTIKSMTKEALFAETTIDFKTVKNDEIEHTLTATVTATGTYGSEDIDFDIAYLSLDGTYFTIDSVKKNSNVVDELSGFTRC